MTCSLMHATSVTRLTTHTNNILVFKNEIVLIITVAFYIDIKVAHAYIIRVHSEQFIALIDGVHLAFRKQNI